MKSELSNELGDTVYTKVKFYDDAEPEANYIDEETFYIPEGLVELYISDHVNDDEHRVLTIKNGQFSGVTTLTTIYLPFHLEKIESAAFSGTENLIYITVPVTVTTLERTVFEGIQDNFFIVAYYDPDWTAGANPSYINHILQFSNIIYF